jgi:hypothetical protein
MKNITKEALKKCIRKISCPIPTFVSVDSSIEDCKSDGGFSIFTEDTFIVHRGARMSNQGKKNNMGNIQNYY